MKFMLVRGCLRVVDCIMNECRQFHRQARGMRLAEGVQRLKHGQDVAEAVIDTL